MILIIVFPRTRIVRAVRKRVPPAGPGKGFTTEPDGEEELYYSTSVDLEELHQLARRAAQNKSGKAVDGSLEVRILERRRLP